MIAKQLHKTGLIPHHAIHQPGSPLLELCEVSLRYNGRVALEAVSFQVNNGQRVAVVGPNGAGKSTLFKVIAGLLPATSGEVKVSGAGPGGHICIAYVPQRSQVDWEFPVVVTDVVMMGRIGKLGLLRWPRARDWDHVHHALEVVGLSHLANRQIGELSGGEQQRMFIARALAQEAELMLMDEPLTGLDVPSQEGIFEILDGLGQQGVTVLIAMHDLKLATDRFEQVMLLNRSLIGYGKPTDIFTPERLVAAYGGHLRLVGAGDELLALSDTCCDEVPG
ncbi:MAG TPA: metal ABC transporter ATP-binding protein [Anaerolineales bacterium]|nr:metal ABC transporter ATP-binding protein [Anaerolineales bacterium]